LGSKNAGPGVQHVSHVVEITGRRGDNRVGAVPWKKTTSTEAQGTRLGEGPKLQPDYPLFSALSLALRVRVVGQEVTRPGHPPRTRVHEACQAPRRRPWARGWSGRGPRPRYSLSWRVRRVADSQSGRPSLGATNKRLWPEVAPGWWADDQQRPGRIYRQSQVQQLESLAVGSRTGQ